MASITIQHLVKRTTDIQDRMTLKAVKKASQNSSEHQGLHDDLTRIISETASSVKMILAKRNKTAADLPIRTRRAYQWIYFLSDPENLNKHLDAVQRVIIHIPQYLSKRSKLKLNFAFYHLGSLYKISRNSSGQDITVQESFIHAPDRVLAAFLDTAISKQSKSSRQLIREYTFSPDYQASRTSLEYLDVPGGSFSQGNSYNLILSFERVNQQYFQGKFLVPHLVWSNRLTYRKFGHYQWDIDTVMISQTLDNHRMPEFVLDYVMYHELLHKKLGMKKVNQRRFAHTKKFRDEEGKYMQYEEAKQILNRISQKKS